MSFGVVVIAHNEEEFIEAQIRQWGGTPVLVLVSKKSWNNDIPQYDATADLARDMGAEVIEGYWKTEHDQRNYGLARFVTFDRVFIADADEFYTKDDIEKMKRFIEDYRGEFQGAFVSRVRTYWKTLDYVFDPPDKHKPIVCVDPTMVQFYEHRQARPIFVDEPFLQTLPILPVEMHHLSWVRSDRKAQEKILAFSHAKDIHPDWIRDVWNAWTPNSNMNIRPYGTPSFAVFEKRTEDLGYNIGI